MQKTTKQYDAVIDNCRELFTKRMHDCGSTWRILRLPSLNDLILQNLLGVKQIEDNQGKTIVSEGIGVKYRAMINYAVFALKHINELQLSN